MARLHRLRNSVPSDVDFFDNQLKCKAEYQANF